MSVLKEAVALYRKKFLVICLVAVTVVIPFNFLITFAVNYVNLPLQVFVVPLWPTLVKISFSIVAYYIMQLPFISMAFQYFQSEQLKVSRVYGDTLTYGFPVYVISILCAILVAFGSLIFLLPGLVLLIWFLGVPYAAVIDDMRWLRGLKQSFRFGNARFFQLIGFLVVFALIDFGISYAISFGVIYFFKSLAILNLSLMVINALLLPLFAFILTHQYLDWIGYDPENDPADFWMDQSLMQTTR